MTVRRDEPPIDAIRGDGVVLAFPGVGRCVDEDRKTPSLTALEARRLRRLRELLAKSRLDGDSDVDAAVARLSANAAAEAAVYGVMLFHAFAEACERRLTFFCQVCPVASDDEWWLLRLIDALATGDEAGADALLGFRIRPVWRRRIRFLAAGLARGVDADAGAFRWDFDDSTLNVSSSATMR